MSLVINIGFSSSSCVYQWQAAAIVNPKRESKSRVFKAPFLTSCRVVSNANECVVIFEHHFTCVEFVCNFILRYSRWVPVCSAVNKKLSAFFFRWSMLHTACFRIEPAGFIPAKMHVHCLTHRHRQT
jgi:hypothetical protein